MRRHYLDKCLAVEVGPNAALLFDYFAHTTVRNMERGENVSGGKVWTYTTAKDGQRSYSYMSEWQVKSALHKLQDAGLLEKGGPVNTPRGRATAYTVPHDRAQAHCAAIRELYGREAE